MWRLKQYKDKGQALRDECDQQMREKLDQRLGLLLEKGNNLRLPVSKPLGGGLFELRAQSGRLRARLIYYFAGNEIIVVHAFLKKTSAIPKNELRIAIRNKKAIQEGAEVPNVFNYVN